MEIYLNDKKTICQKLLDNLSELAKNIIKDQSENMNFRSNPDDPNEHDPKWHQFGIITHTKKFYEFYQTECQEYFQHWGIDKYINKKLSEQIDGKTRAELLEISIVLHDLGKFDRSFKEERGVLKPNYKGHEDKSERLIMGNKHIQNLLRGTYELTESQISYIGCCAGLHYELGKVREKQNNHR